MAATALPAGGIALYGAPDSDLGSKDVKQAPLQAMLLEMTPDMVDELLESEQTGKSPQLCLGRTPQLRYGNKAHALQTTPEDHRYELYKSSGPGSDGGLEFAALISHRLAVQKAEEATAGVDTALEQLRSSMAAISESREANKTIVGTNGRISTPTHRRVPSKGFRPGHLAPSSLGSPMRSAPSSPMLKPPTSQPNDGHDLLLRALRVPLIHLLAVQPARDSHLAETCRTSLANVRDLLPKIAKASSDPEKWQLTDKSFRELNPWKFYKSAEDRTRAIDNAVKSFDRLRLPKDDQLWQILLPVEERGQGKCLSRLNVKAPEHKPATPLHKIKLGTDKKPAAAKKAEDNRDNSEKETKKARGVKVKQDEVETKPKKMVKSDKITAKSARETSRKPANAAPQTATTQTSTSTPDRTFTSTTTSSNKPTAPSHRSTPSTDDMKIRMKTVKVQKNGATPRVEPKMPSKDVKAQKEQKDRAPQKDRVPRPSFKPSRPINTKPKNPSPLSASPPVNASDFEDTHPVHKALSGAPSPSKASVTNSDRSLKRKANDLDNGIHDHFTSVKQARVDRPTPTHTPASTNGRGTSTPLSASSLKRRSDDSSTSDTSISKFRKGNTIDTSLSARYTDHNGHSTGSPDDSSSTTSPVRLSFRQTVELSQKFTQYYKRYEELYWKLADSDIPPTDTQRAELMKMHKKLEEMKRNIKDGGR